MDTTETNGELINWKIIFIAGATWNLLGSIFGMIFTELTFSTLFDKELTDPLFISIYRGAWGTSFLYFFGYLLVAFNPTKHTGIVILGTLGKFFFVINLLSYYLAGLATNYVLIIIIGDVIFTIIFLVYLFEMYKQRELI